MILGDPTGTRASAAASCPARADETGDASVTMIGRKAPLQTSRACHPPLHAHVVVAAITERLARLLGQRA